MCPAWRAFKVFYLAGADTTIFPGFLLEALFGTRYVSSISKKCCSVFLRLRISMKTARLATTLGFLCRDRFGLDYCSALGALRALCRVSRVHVPRGMKWFSSTKKKKEQAAGPNSLVGATLMSEG